MSCRIDYIDKSDLDSSEKNRLKDIHTSVFQSLGKSPNFYKKDGRLYSHKYKYPTAMSDVAKTNTSYGKRVVSFTKDSFGRTYLYIDVMPLAVMQQQITNDLAYTIKPGVTELFDSTPELANAVYEALGMWQELPYNFNVIELESKVRIEAIYKDEVIGYINFFKNYLNQYRVSSVEVLQNARGQKVGLNLYKKAIEYATNKNSVIIPDVQTSEQAAKIYKNLEKEGLFKIKRISEQSQDGRYVIEGESTGTLPTKEITPQQKQQAQQLYSQYLDSLNKPNTNPILQGNQQEQIKKFAELQERLNNKEFLEGAKNAYESTSALQQFGTQEQYNDYIARVSLGIIKNPSSGEYNYTSKVKDIVYHNTNEQFEKFKTTPVAKFFTKSPIGGRKYRVPVVLNTSNPKVFSKFTEDDEMTYGLAEMYAKNKEKDGIINGTEGKTRTEYIVFEPQQIHNLGSKQDIAGFKNFVKDQKEVEEFSNEEILEVWSRRVYSTMPKEEFMAKANDIIKSLSYLYSKNDILRMLECL